MRRALVFIFIFLIGLSLIAESVKAEQIVYLNFDGFQVVENSQSISLSANVTGITKSYTYVLSFTSVKYLSSMTFADVSQICDYPTDPPAHITITVSVNGQQVASKTFYVAPSKLNINWTPIKGTDFTVNVTITVVGPSTTFSNSFSSSKQYFYVSSEPYRIASLLTSFKYVPPGAENSPQGFILNQTEMELNKTYNLAEGTLKFWLKWDGTKPLSITDNIGIDSNGYLYVKDSAGNAYTLEGVTPPLGVYVPVAVGWKAGYGYIILNSTIIKLNWQGNFTLNKIGDIDQQSGTVIDELIVFDSFISEDYILQVEGQESFSININGKIIKVYPDGGVHLPTPTTISFYDENNTLLTYYDWYGSNEVYDAPNNTYKIILSAGGASSVYLISALDSDIAFLSSDAQGVIEDISIIPSEPGTLVIKNTKGQIIYADSAKQTNTVLGIMGGSYYIKFTDANGVTRAAGWFTFSGGGITLLLSSSIKEAGGLYADAWWEDGALKVEFVDDLNATSSWNMTISYYNQGQTITTFTIKETSKRYIGSFIPPSDADYAFVEIKADNGFKKEIGVYLNDNYGSQTVPESVFPSWLLFGIFGIGGLLIAPARFKFISPLIAVFILGFAKLAGLFDTPAWLLSSLTGLAILSLIIYRPSSRGGVI